VNDDERVWDDDDDVEDVDDDEVLTPDEVSGPGPVRRQRGGPRPPQPDKYAKWSMYAGIASIPLIVISPLLLVFLASTALYLGFRARKELADAEAPELARRRAKIGTVCGSLAVLTAFALIIFFTFFFDIPEKVNDFNTDKTTEPG
jgi:hypothetical protein